MDALAEPKKYYRVAFYGSAFGPELDGVTFVYRFGNTVGLLDCVDIVKQKVKEVLGSADKAELLPSNKKVENLDLSKNYVQVVSVLPHWSRDEQQRRLSSPALQNLGLMHFLQQIPFTKNPKHAFSSHLDEQWMKKVVSVTSSHFSFAPSRIRILYEETDHLSPIQMCESMIYDRVMSVKQALVNQEQTSYIPLLMILQGSLMMTPDTGPYEMMKLFLEGANAEKHSQEHVRKLATILKQFALVLKPALDIVEAHALTSSPQTLPLIEELKKSYVHFEATLNSYPVMQHS